MKTRAIGFGLAASALTLAASFLTVAPAQAQGFRPNAIGPRAPAMMSNIGPRGPNVTGPRNPGFERDPGDRYPSGLRPKFRPPVYSVAPVILLPAVVERGPQRPRNAQQPPAQRTTGVPPQNERRYVPNEVVIEVAGAVSEQQAEALSRRFRLVRLQSTPLTLRNSTVFRWRIPDQRSVTSVIRQIEAARAVQSVQPNYLYTLSQSASAPIQPASIPPVQAAGDPAQYTLGKLRLPLAHNVTKGERVLIAVIDSGIDADHPELAGVVSDTFEGLEKPEGPHAHGTAIAGAIAAHAKLMGVAPSARILGVRAFGAGANGGEGTTFAILKGLDWSVAKGARIINMSFAGPPDPALSRGLVAASAKGVVLIAAAGNAGAKSAPLYPAADPSAIAVSATDNQDRLFDASNRGTHIAIAAPGVDILVPSPGGRYQMSSGTSFAAAHISGIVALMLGRRSDLSPDAVRAILGASAQDIGAKGRDAEFGAGLADAYRAVTTTDAYPAQPGVKIAPVDASARR